MGIVDIYREIDNISEEKFKEILVTGNEKAAHVKDFNSLVKYFGKNSSFIDCICEADYERAKVLFTKIVNAFQLKDIDIDEKVNYIRLNWAYELKRLCDWEFHAMPLIHDGEGEQSLTCCMAQFITSNKRGDEFFLPFWDKLIHDKNRNVVWVKTDYKDPEFFLYLNNEYYIIKKEYKCLKIYTNIDTMINGITVNENYDNLDDIIKKYSKDEITYAEISIDLSECFPKGFFYKGPKWTRDSYPNPDEIIIYREIKIVNELIRIEIENISYPHKGYALIDFRNFKIIEAEKYFFSIIW
jgi:hypothetical protein